MPCPNDILQTSWLLTIPLVAHGMGSKEVDNFIYVCMERLANQIFGFPIPFFWFTVPVILYANNFSGIKETLSFMI